MRRARHLRDLEVPGDPSRHPDGAAAHQRHESILILDYPNPRNMPKASLSSLLLGCLDEDCRRGIDIGGVDQGRQFVPGESG
jgi:hypothetical protein